MKRIIKRSLLSHHVKWITVTAARDVLRLRIANMAYIYIQYAVADTHKGRSYCFSIWLGITTAQEIGVIKKCSTGPRN